mgnify:CR=1 FL=1
MAGPIPHSVERVQPSKAPTSTKLIRHRPAKPTKKPKK